MFRCRRRRGPGGDVVAGGAAAAAAPSRRKVLFVHIYKTAGSTMREFFNEYSRLCGAGFAVLVGCADLEAEADDDHGDDSGAGRGGGGGGVGLFAGTKPYKKDDRMKRRKVPCHLRRSLGRDGSMSEAVTNVTIPRVTGEYLGERFDLIGGHLQLGVGAVWTDAADSEGRSREREEAGGGGGLRDGDDDNLRYVDDGSPGLTNVAFFRNAVDKYVSGVSYATKAKAGRPLPVIAKVRELLPAKLALGEYAAKIREYLITPHQRRRYGDAGIDPSAEEQAVRAMMNLLDFDVLVGIAERMSESLSMLEPLMDPEGAVPEVFAKYGRAGGPTRPADGEGGDGAEANRTLKTRKANVNGLSTSYLVEILKKEDKFLFMDILEYTKFEQQITDFSLALHLRQEKEVERLKPLLLGQ